MVNLIFEVMAEWMEWMKDVRMVNLTSLVMVE